MKPKKPRKRTANIPFGGIVKLCRKGSKVPAGVYTYYTRPGREEKDLQLIRDTVEQWKKTYSTVAGWKRAGHGNYNSVVLADDYIVFFPHTEIPFNELGEISL